MLQHDLFEVNDPERLQFFISPLHLRGRIMNWLVKGFCHQDFKSHEARGKQNQWVRDMRRDEVEERFKSIMNQPMDWQNSTGNVIQDAFNLPVQLAEVLVIYPDEWFPVFKVLFKALTSGFGLSHERVELKIRWLREEFHRSDVGQWHRPNVYTHVFFQHLVPMLKFFPVPPDRWGFLFCRFNKNLFRSGRGH